MINAHLVLVSFSVYTFDVSNTTVEDKQSAVHFVTGIEKRKA